MPLQSHGQGYLPALCSGALKRKFLNIVVGCLSTLFREDPCPHLTGGTLAWEMDRQWWGCPANAKPRPQAQLTRCQVPDHVQRGRNGAWYGAKCTVTGKLVTIKTTLNLQDRHNHPGNELENTEKLQNHPNILRLVHAFPTITGGRLYWMLQKLPIKCSFWIPHKKFLNLVMEYAPETLRDIICRYRSTHPATSMPIHLVQLYLYQILRAVAYAHSQGVAQLDVRLDNLVVYHRSRVVKLRGFAHAVPLAHCSLAASRDARAVGRIAVAMMARVHKPPHELEELAGRLCMCVPAVDATTVMQAMAHPFFDALRKVGARMPGDNSRLPPLFNWIPGELNEASHHERVILEAHGMHPCPAVDIVKKREAALAALEESYTRSLSLSACSVGNTLEESHSLPAGPLSSLLSSRSKHTPRPCGLEVASPDSVSIAGTYIVRELSAKEAKSLSPTSKEAMSPRISAIPAVLHLLPSTPQAPLAVNHNDFPKLQQAPPARPVQMLHVPQSGGLSRLLGGPGRLRPIPSVRTLVPRPAPRAVF